jgi:NADH dehydrogenase FAD-containing subunit
LILGVVTGAAYSAASVILGGGFAGMRTAECLEEKLPTDFSISLILINETDAFQFTPVLAEFGREAA